MVWICSEEIKCFKCGWVGESWGLESTKDENGKIINKCPKCGNMIPDKVTKENNPVGEVILEGTWMYNGNVSCNLRIIKWNVLYGSGDYEDLPEIRDDKEIDCFYIEFESMIEKGRYDSRRGGFLTLSEAIIEAEKVTGQKVNWKNQFGKSTL